MPGLIPADGGCAASPPAAGRAKGKALEPFESAWVRGFAAPSQVQGLSSQEVRVMKITLWYSGFSRVG